MILFWPPSRVLRPRFRQSKLARVGQPQIILRHSQSSRLNHPDSSEPVQKALRRVAAAFGVLLIAGTSGGRAMAQADGSFQPPGQFLARSALGLSDQFIFTPNDLDLDFFALDTDLKWEWVPGSLEWVRVDRRFLVPKARAKIKVEPGTTLRYHDVLFQSPTDTIEVPVILSGESGNQLVPSGKATRPIGVRFRHARALNPGVVLDSNCSQTQVQISSPKLDHSWVYVSCLTVHPKQDTGFVMRSDLELRWETESGVRSIRINGEASESADGVSHLLSFNPESGVYHLEKGGDSFDLKIPVPERFHPLWVSLGIGPYSHQNVVRAFPTIYAGYYFSEGMKLASFSAFPIRAKPEVDTGLYLVSEQFRGIDERINFNLLLGAHVLSFHSDGKQYIRMSAPQGIEIGFRDFLIRRQNFTFGGFFYPLISNRSYINSWIRFGNSNLFYEFNFIQWQEPTDTGTFSAKSAGVSIGFPLFRAL